MAPDLKDLTIIARLDTLESLMLEKLGISISDYQKTFQSKMADVTGKNKGEEEKKDGSMDNGGS